MAYRTSIEVSLNSGRSRFFGSSANDHTRLQIFVSTMLPLIKVLSLTWEKRKNRSSFKLDQAVWNEFKPLQIGSNRSKPVQIVSNRLKYVQIVASWLKSIWIGRNSSIRDVWSIYATRNNTSRTVGSFLLPNHIHRSPGRAHPML